MNEEAIETFSRKYVVDKRLVEKYIQYLKYLDIRKRRNQREKTKSC